jgi:hypothetical protein
MELGDNLIDDFKDFMRFRQEYLKSKHHSVLNEQHKTPDSTNEAQHLPSTESPVPPKQSESGFQIIPLPQDLQANLVKCVKDEGMKVMTPETIFIQQTLRELALLRGVISQNSEMLKLVLSAFGSHTNQSFNRSPLLPVAQQDDNAFRPIEVKQEEESVPDSRRGTKRKRNARNRRSAENGES